MEDEKKKELLIKRIYNSAKAVLKNVIAENINTARNNVSDKYDITMASGKSIKEALGKMKNPNGLVKEIIKSAKLSSKEYIDTIKQGFKDAVELLDDKKASKALKHAIDGTNEFDDEDLDFDDEDSGNEGVMLCAPLDITSDKLIGSLLVFIMNSINNDQLKNWISENREIVCKVLSNPALYKEEPMKNIKTTTPGEVNDTVEMLFDAIDETEAMVSKAVNSSGVQVEIGNESVKDIDTPDAKLLLLQLGVMIIYDLNDIRHEAMNEKADIHHKLVDPFMCMLEKLIQLSGIPVTPEISEDGTTINTIKFIGSNCVTVQKLVQLANLSEKEAVYVAIAFSNGMIPEYILRKLISYVGYYKTIITGGN